MQSAAQLSGLMGVALQCFFFVVFFLFALLFIFCMQQHSKVPEKKHCIWSSIW